VYNKMLYELYRYLLYLKVNIPSDNYYLYNPIFIFDDLKTFGDFVTPKGKYLYQEILKYNSHDILRYLVTFNIDSGELLLSIRNSSVYVDLETLHIIFDSTAVPLDVLFDILLSTNNKNNYDFLVGKLPTTLNGEQIDMLTNEMNNVIINSGRDLPFATLVFLYQKYSHLFTEDNIFALYREAVNSKQFRMVTFLANQPTMIKRFLTD